ncbi:MAG: hypothetical protein H0X31_05110 [Nostocaceae cyanobacterium]|nr:hypothetical protein [Nostocaceae cyanobacterium]
MIDPANQATANTSANLNQFDDDVIVSSSDERLSQEKIDARMRLLAMPPEEAQKLANQTLQPQLWRFDPSTHFWDESIPTHYGEDSDSD